MNFPTSRSEISVGKIAKRFSVSGTLDITENGERDVAAYEKVNVNVEGGGSSIGQHIYGVRWGYDENGVINTAGTRTDEAAEFNDPVPYVFGASQEAAIQSALTCGSPFDDLYPWNGMVPYKDRLMGHMVAIPKFWYKWTKADGEYLQLQVATYAADGFQLSPAHRARNAQDHDRDVVYIARYHASEMLASFTDNAPLANVTRGGLRQILSTQMTQLGQSGYSIQDYAMVWTWRMLYLVEFANWDGQSTIGKGCGTGYDGESDWPECDTCGGTGEVYENCETCNGAGTVADQGEEVECPRCGGTGKSDQPTECSTCHGTGHVEPADAQTEPMNSGTTDNMPYHTGTMAASRDTNAQGIQYRYIEDPWAGVFEWVDGIRLGVDEDAGKGYVAVIMDPAEFSDVENGAEVFRDDPAKVPNGWITDWTIPETEGFDWALVPVTNGESDSGTKGVLDYCGFDGPCFCVGAPWYWGPHCGPFYLGSVVASWSYVYIGARLQKIP